MSSRQLKKLRKLQQEKELLEKTTDSAHSDVDEESDESDAIVTAPKPKNAFAAFAALDDGEDDDDDDDVEEEEKEDEAIEQHLEKEPEPEPKPEPGTTPKKKKNKKKKKKNANKASKTAADDDENKNDNDDDSMDEIDRALKEINMGRGVQKQEVTEASDPVVWQGYKIGKIHFHRLKVANELRDMFGKDTVNAVQNEQRHNSDGRRGLTNMDLEAYLQGDIVVPGSKVSSATEILAKRNPFIQRKNTWPRGSSGGLSMRKMPASEGSCSYSFVHGKPYQELEAEFLTYAKVHAHEMMIHFLRRHPYHICSLIQVSEIAENEHNYTLATDLCERALYSFGQVSSSAFRKDLEDGKAQFPSEYPENRQFMLVIHKYIWHLVRRGTYRTALEWTRLLLTVNPHDEYGQLYYLPMVAIRAWEAEWLLDFIDDKNELEAELEAAAVTHPHILTSRSKERERWDHIVQASVLAYLQLDREDEAVAAAVDGIAKVPWLYEAIYRELKMDVPPAVWGIQPDNVVDTLYTRLCVHLLKDDWDTPRARSVLKKAGDTYKHKVAIPKRANASEVSMGTVRLAYLSGSNELLGLIPEFLLNREPNYTFDPLPPAVDDNIFSYPALQIPWMGGGDADVSFMHPRLARVARAPQPQPEREPELEREPEPELEPELQQHQQHPPPPQPQPLPHPADEQRPPGFRMPGTWIEDEEDEEFIGRGGA